MTKLGKKILVTGGTGYIGSHTCVELINTGYEVTVIDNLTNSKACVLERIREITGKRPRFEQIDLLDFPALTKVFKAEQFDGVIHFAGLKAVGESTQKPLLYYQNNVGGTLNLLNAMQDNGVRDLVFSSSATIYGNAEIFPITENSPRCVTNPYGGTKMVIEDILNELHSSDSDWNFSVLRYFNPVGAHESGLIGEDPSGIPNNLMPYIQQVAIGKLKKLPIWGGDYPTHDGTGVRDYIHVTDLAVGHIRALQKLEDGNGKNTYNLGSGQGYSVLDVVKAFECASGKKIPYEILARRPGDVAESWADISLAQSELDWNAELDLGLMFFDSWRWQQKNPNGYL